MIYDNIRYLCDTFGISLNYLESQVGLGMNTIHKWKSVRPRVDTMQRVADFFGFPVDWFLREHK